MERFSEYIPFQERKGEHGQYNTSIVTEKSAQFFSDLGVYQFRKNPEIAINHILEGLRLSISINSVKNMINCLTLFEKYREWASVEAKKRYKNLSSEVNQLNAEKNMVILGYK
ncbi:hypothetical protein [Paenibacillus illinoisensis]|uniref:hypothetical protein n=1 Tax=Paenibacillus illinoisensis TaxID=59845 RepID=UPI00301DFC63